MSHPDSCGDGQPTCRWWCPIHEEHHSVPSLVNDCKQLEVLTHPEAVGE